MATSRNTSRARGRAPRRATDAGTNATDLAKLLGVTREAVRLWTNDGCPRRDDGTYLVAEVVTWLRERDRRALRDETAPKEAQERARKMRIDADRSELAYRQELGELLPLAEFQQQIETIVGGFAAVASGQLARFEKKIVAAQTPADARRITEQIHAALMAGARAFADRMEADADAEPEDTAA
ncbi:MAG: hypothetical protein H3C62_18435 [Gemmatimonadaceae bacterium]|nr:hypothetical protein [Gemmatimonadaceae bacterium]